MEDSRIFGCGAGVECRGDVKATRCTIEDNRGDGVYVEGEQSSGELKDCVIRKNGSDGVT